MRAAKLSGERKPVTALFVDVVGSTAHLERMDPEDWTEIINEAFDLMSEAVYRYEGTIAQLQGDAMLAFFGAPVAHEDDPERAVLAALDMVASVTEFARQLKADRGVDFEIRAGIDSGPVVVGNVGTDLRYEYTALGDAVNVAARLQAAAEPGSVLVTGGTHRLLGGQFEVEDLGAIDLKGKSERVRALRVLGRREAPGRRRGLDSIGISSPMVGRDELARHAARAPRRDARRPRPARLHRRRAGHRQEPPARRAAPSGRRRASGRRGRGDLDRGPLRLVRPLAALPPPARRRPRLAGPAEHAGGWRRRARALDERLRTDLGEEADDIAPYFAHLLGAAACGRTRPIAPTSSRT